MTGPKLAPGFEVVHFVLAWYDGVLAGYADHGGEPHHFQQEGMFEEADRPENAYRNAPASVTDDPDGWFRLTPISPEVFAAAVETWEIWCRWERANRETMPGTQHSGKWVLPEDAARSLELDAIVEGWLTLSRERAFFRRGDFNVLVPGAWHSRVRGAQQVRWSR